MSAPSAIESGSARRDPWPLRLAIAVHPTWWQNGHDDAGTTLADVAAARGRVPVMDVIGMIARGILLRARTSVVFWLGLTLIGLEWLATSTSFSGFHAERVWASVLIHAGGGVMSAVPIVAGSAAWLASRPGRDRNVPARSRLAGLGRDACAVLGFSAAGYLLMVVLVLIDSGWPAMAIPDLGFTAGFAAMTVSAFGLGTVVGAVIPDSPAWRSETAIAVRVLGFALALALGILAMASDWWQNGVLGWRNVTGSALTFEADYGTLGTSNPHITLVTIGYAAFFSMAAVCATALRGTRARMLALIVALTVVIGGSAAISGSLLAFVGDPVRPMLFRSASELHCAGTAPQICLWPEQDQLHGADLRDTMRTAFRKTEALELFDSVPSTLTASASIPAGAEALGVYNGTAFDRDTIIALFAMSVTSHGSCLSQPDRIGPEDQNAATYGLTLLLGGASPSITQRFFSDAPAGHRPSATRVRDRLGIRSPADARAAITHWLSERALCPAG